MDVVLSSVTPLLHNAEGLTLRDTKIACLGTKSSTNKGKKYQYKYIICEKQLLQDKTYFHSSETNNHSPALFELAPGLYGKFNPTP